MMTKKIIKQDVKNDPKVPISLRVPSKLKEALKEKATLQNKKLSEYVGDLLKEKFSSETTKVATKKVEYSPLKNVHLNQNDSFWNNQKQEITDSNLEPSSLETDSKPKYDEDLVFLIEPHFQEYFQMYINHLRKKYGGSPSDVIVASLIAITDDEHRLFPKSFNYYLKGVLLNTYADNQPYTDSIKTINYRKIVKHSFFIFLLFLFMKKIRTYNFK